MLCLAPQRAFAQPPSVRLELAEGCPNAAQFHARLAALLEGRPAPSGGLVRIVRQGDGYALEVSTSDVTRKLQNAACAELVESAAVILALSAEPVVTPGPEPTPAPELRATLSPPVSAPPASPASPTSRSVGVFAFAELSGSHGLVPRIGFRPALGVVIGGTRYGGGLAFDYVLPRQNDEAQGVRVRAAGTSLSVQAVLHPIITLALAGDLHLLWGRGFGVNEARAGRMPLWSARAELAFSLLERASTRVLLVLSGAVPFARGRFRYRDGGTAYQPSPVQALVGLRFGFVRRP